MFFSVVLSFYPGVTILFQEKLSENVVCGPRGVLVLAGELRRKGVLQNLEREGNGRFYVVDHSMSF